jgi:hypothetical protein
MSYDPTIGRWTAEDPIDFDGGDVNLFRYAANDPIDSIDQTGLRAVTLTQLYPKTKKPAWKDLFKNKELQCELQMMIKKHDKTKQKQGLWILWNPTTGQVMITDVGTFPKDKRHVGFGDPGVGAPWEKMGTAHSHQGPGIFGGPSMDLEEDGELVGDQNNVVNEDSPLFNLPGASVRGPKIWMYYGPNTKTDTLMMEKCK